MAKGTQTDTNLYEQLVQIYLRVFEHLILMPQFQVVFKGEGTIAGKAWEPCFLEDVGGREPVYKKSVDLLAVSVKGHEAQLVEVTKAQPPGEHLCRMLLAKRQDDQLTDGQITERYARWYLGDSFTVRWRFFFPGGANNCHVEAFKKKLENQPVGDRVVVTPLEHVLEALRSKWP